MYGPQILIIGMLITAVPATTGPPKQEQNGLYRLPSSSSDSSLREHIIRNTQHLEDIDRRLGDIDAWRVERDRDEEVLMGEHRELQITVAQHDRMIWAVISILILVVVNAVVGLFKRRNGAVH